MPLSHITKVFATKDAKVSKLTADPAGGSTTYATSIDVPGIKSVTISGTLDTKTLRGDQVLLDSDTVLTDITVAFEYAKLNEDLLPVWVGGAVADSGTTPNQKAEWSLLGTDTLFPSWKFEAQVVSVDTPGGDMHLILWKCKLSDFPSIGTAEDDYQTFSTAGIASPRLSDNKWINLPLNETAVAIA
jgi:hypothetical protein